MLHWIADAPVPPTPGPDGGFEQTLMMIGVALVFFYFILWRPESKKRKELEAKRQGLKKGDHVIVAGGILGEVFKIKTDTVIVQLVDNAKMEVVKAAIQDVQLTSVPGEKAESSSQG